MHYTIFPRVLCNLFYLLLYYFLAQYKFFWLWCETFLATTSIVNSRPLWFSFLLLAPECVSFTCALIHTFYAFVILVLCVISSHHYMPSARALIYSHFAPVFVSTLFIIWSRPLRVIFTRLLCSPQSRYVFSFSVPCRAIYMCSLAYLLTVILWNLATPLRTIFIPWNLVRLLPALTPLCGCVRAFAPGMCAFAPCVAACACLLPVCARLPPVWLCARARYLYVRVCLLLCVCVRLPLCVRVCLLLFVRACLPLCVCDCLPLCVCARTCPCMCMWGTCFKYFVFWVRVEYSTLDNIKKS